MQTKPWQQPLQLLDSASALNRHVSSHGQATRTLAQVAFGRETIAVQVGGDKRPAIVLTAGAHATEIEGILAAIHLIETLETEHRTYVVPTRDPLGMEGFSSTLQLAAESELRPTTYEDVMAILRCGDAIYDDGHLVIASYGPLSFVAKQRQPEWTPWGHHVIYEELRQLVATNRELGMLLTGRRILIPAASPHLEGLGDFDRAWTAVGARDDMLHLNRFFEDPSAPVEVSSVRGLLDDVCPGLVIDLHAGTSDRFWLPYPLPQQDDALSKSVAQAMAKAVMDAGYETATLEELRVEGGISPTFFDSYVDFGNGVTPFYTSERGEGLNFMDYCRPFGVAVGTEAGQRASLAAREDMIYRAAVAGIRAWENLVAGKTP